ncbi:uncharacterized protein BDR25DRAFT_210488 [Lindgomyces ingoldianus]|uniref:Uncharacterized protein n=1 Tax=Lindgomyces ingoldianus TaxID=673940 RepID=A0ACB6RD21_9PLEO|nr:uncharacterized protein BDR25DRAFT_210488 [Lindgomyces ingoldianus]KAF2476376.1 hypothetical protein BDR25DRAFT_210488 [Lindgomyces ingoldianus]
MQTRSSTKASLSHKERTATEPRSRDLHPVIVDSIMEVGDTIRTFRLAIEDRQNGINFLPGQWLDVHVPGIEKAGGFTITSSPRDAVAATTRSSSPFLELAVQRSPDNPPAAWLWQPTETILGSQLAVRVGGSFIWPPPGLDSERIKRVVFIAGGVGINPLISMLSYIREENVPLDHVRLLYSTKLPSKTSTKSEVLFLPRILDLFCTSKPPPRQNHRDRLELFFTGTLDGSLLCCNEDVLFQSFVLPGFESEGNLPVVAWGGRINEHALSSAVGNEKERGSAVFYVCGPPDMTDSIVQYLKDRENVAPESVLCEKWW